MLSVCCLLGLALNAQQNPSLVAGPMLGNVEMRTAIIWLEVAPVVKNVVIRYWEKGRPQSAQTISYKGILHQAFNPLQLELTGLQMNTTYQYQLVLDGKVVKKNYPMEFTTKALWQWRQPAPDFDFLTGSCAYFNEPVYDRPGIPYGKDSSIFLAMAKTPASFMIWLGDNWYTREADFSSAYGLQYRASHDRSLPVLQPFLAAMPHYAIWDDHDYGPDESDKSYIFKAASRRIFQQYWANPSYGQEGRGIYSTLSYSDCDFFLLDDRYFRSNDHLPDSVNGRPNPEKQMYGPEQLEWLKNALVGSQATFKFIVTGSQVLNPVSRSDCLRHFPAEFDELVHFIENNKIGGVLFLTGDRHHSEVIRLERPGTYPLYDITASPLTAGVAKVTGNELHNPYRVAGTLVEAQNYARISITGPAGKRKLTVDFLGIHNKRLGGVVLDQKELYP